MQLKRIDFLK